MHDSVQKFALQVCSKQWDPSCSMLCSSLNLPIYTLAAMRKHMKRGTLYRIVHCLADFPSAPISMHKRQPF